MLSYFIAVYSTKTELNYDKNDIVKKSVYNFPSMGLIYSKHFSNEWYIVETVFTQSLKCKQAFFWPSIYISI